MRTFVRVIEIWVPTKKGDTLELGSGIYGNLEGFRQISEVAKFKYDVGLPGKAWAKRAPVVLKSFENSIYMRMEAAHEAGLTSAIAIPFFSGEFLQAVVLFLCGDKEHLSGAIEVWKQERPNELGLFTGFYGNLEKFESLSRLLKFRRGHGLPGKTWDQGMPLIMADLAHSNSFLRSQDAAKEGITTALGIPCFGQDGLEYITTLLSSKETPIVKRFEIWCPDEKRRHLVFQSGITYKNTEVERTKTSRRIQKGRGVIGLAWLTGAPKSTEQSSIELTLMKQPIYENMDSLIAIPVINNGLLKSVVALYL